MIRKRPMSITRVAVLFFAAMAFIYAFGWLATPGNLSSLVIIWKGMGG